MAIHLVCRACDDLQETTVSHNGTLVPPNEAISCADSCRPLKKHVNEIRKSI